MEADIVYASKKDYLQNDIELKLDVYYPAEETEEKRPAVIWLHGGGMYTGSKNESWWDPTCVLAKTFFEQLGEKGVMKTLPQSGHSWADEMDFLESCISEFLDDVCR